jgi:hypothetical protein
MTDHNGGSVLHEGLQGIQNLLFRIGVHAGQSVVENKNLGVPNQSPGNRRSLLLSTREGDASFSNEGLELVREFLHLGKNM